MRQLKLEYYHAETYEKYRVNSILNLLVDRQKLQEESLDLNHLGNQNNYSIIAYLGSQIRSCGEGNYQNIDTNDVILALSELKKLDEQIAYNEDFNGHYIRELAQQLYREYAERGQIPRNSYHQKSFIEENLQLMNEINRGVETYRYRIENLRGYAEEKRKRETHANPHLIPADLPPELMPSDRNGEAHEDRSEVGMGRKEDGTFLDAGVSPMEYDGRGIGAINGDLLKGGHRSDPTAGSEYEPLRYEKRKSRHSSTYGKANVHAEGNGHPLAGGLAKAEISSNKYYHGEEGCFNDQFESDSIRGHKINSVKSLQSFKPNDRYAFTEQEVNAVDRRKTYIDRREDMSELSYRRSTFKSTNDNDDPSDVNNLTNLQMIQNRNPRGGRFEEEPTGAQIARGLGKDKNPPEHVNDLARRASETIKRIVDDKWDRMSVKDGTNGGASSKRGTANLYPRHSDSSSNSILESIDKAEKQLVQNHLMNSMNQNENVGRRVNAFLSRPILYPQENQMTNAHSRREGSSNIDPSQKRTSGYVRDPRLNEVSLNRYGSLSDQIQNASSDGDASSAIISILKNPPHLDSYKATQEMSAGGFAQKPMRMNSSKEIRSHMMEQMSASPHGDHSSIYSRNVREADNLSSRFRFRSSRALDINDLNSSISRNHAHSNSSIMREASSKDNEKLYERSKSYTSQLSKVPLSVQYSRNRI